MSEWINVKDELPIIMAAAKNYEEYNVYCVHPNDEIVTTLDFTEYGWFGSDGLDWNEYVTHWTQLPAPPEESQ